MIERAPERWHRATPPLSYSHRSLQLGSYDAKGHESNNVISLTGDDGATSNSGSVGEVEDITESFKRKRFEMQMQEAIDLTEKGKKSQTDSEDLEAEGSQTLSLQLKALFFGEKNLHDLSNTGQLDRSAAGVTRSEVRPLAFRSNGSLVEELKLPLARIAYRPFSVPQSASKKEVQLSNEIIYIQRTQFAVIR